MIRLGMIYLAVAVLIVASIAGLPGAGLFGPKSDAVATEVDTPLAGSADGLALASLTTSAPAVAPAANPAGTDDLSAMTAAILAELSGNAGQPAVATGAEADALAVMSQSALQGLRGFGQAAAKPQPDALVGLVAQALQGGQSDAFIDALINEAVGRGEVQVPAAMVTTEGRVDTAVLLASIVAKAQSVEVGEGDAPAAAPVAAPDPLARFIATEDLLYTVEAGDSLGSLALRFYGDAGRYPAIFSANRERLSAPDRISAGQRLVIPSLSRL